MQIKINFRKVILGDLKTLSKPHLDNSKRLKKLNEVLMLKVFVFSVFLMELIQLINCIECSNFVDKELALKIFHNQIFKVLTKV